MMYMNRTDSGLKIMEMVMYGITIVYLILGCRLSAKDRIE